jgi:hypothetical protein
VKPWGIQNIASTLKGFAKVCSIGSPFQGEGPIIRHYPGFHPGLEFVNAFGVKSSKLQQYAFGDCSFARNSFAVQSVSTIDRYFGAIN